MKKQYVIPQLSEMPFKTADLMRAMDGSTSYLPTEPGGPTHALASPSPTQDL